MQSRTEDINAQSKPHVLVVVVCPRSHFLSPIVRVAQWKTAYVATSAPAAAPAAAAAGLDLSAATAGQVLNILVDKSITESAEERMAYLVANGCPQSIIDSVLKNVNLY